MSTSVHEESVNNKTNVAKGLAAGMIGGLVASWVMEEFQAVWLKASPARPRAEAHGSNSASSSTKADQSPSDTETQEPATIKAAGAISRKFFGRELKAVEKKIAGNVVHYAVGSTSGAVYGAAAELAPDVTVAGGVPFGTALWLAVDETAVPLLNLSKGPTAYPLSTHLYALASHFVYGITTEVVRRSLRRTILS